MDKLPTYKVIVNPDDEQTGVYAVSLVDQPAIEVDWIALRKVEADIEEYLFTALAEKQLLYGPLLIPNKLILRRDENGFEYNIVFEEDVIQTIADKYNEMKLGDVFNIQHSDKKVKAYLAENWITAEVDKSKELGFELPKGTWFGGVKVKDKDFWLNEVKSGKLKGFSVEILAGTKLIDLNKTTTEEVDKNKLYFMEYKTKAGLTLYWEGDAEVGKDIFIILENGIKEPLADGEYELEDGTKVVAKDGKVAEIIAAENLQEEVVDTTTTTTKIDPAMVMDLVAPMMEEMRGVIAELSSRLDKLENEESTTEVSEEVNEDKVEVYSKIKGLEEKIELLSKSAGAKSVKVEDEVEKSRKEELLRKINFYKNK